MSNLHTMNSHVLLGKFKEALLSEAVHHLAEEDSKVYEEELNHRLRERSMLFLINEIILHPAEEKMVRETYANRQPIKKI